MMETDRANRTFRALVVDDEDAVRGLVERILRQPGYETRVAGDGPAALKVAASEGPFDILVTDLAMPGMQGDELARRLRQSDPELKVLYLTGYSDRLFAERAVLWEDEAFLEKPVTVQGLLEAVSLLLVGRLPAPRAKRVRVPGARVQFRNGVADLETVSLTGALVHTDDDVAVDSVSPLVIEFPSETVRMTGRVVSCQQRSALSSSETTPRVSYAVAIAFVEPSPGVRLALQRVCENADS
jgi:CheY-like chemotaxis protein